MRPPPGRNATAAQAKTEAAAVERAPLAKPAWILWNLDLSTVGGSLTGVTRLAIGIEGSDDDWFASIVKYMGEKKGLEFFRRLAQMKPQVRTGHTLLELRPLWVLYQRP